VVLTTLLTIAIMHSCADWKPELGEDLLPPGDDVFLHHDTIFQITSYPVTGRRLATSEITFNSETLYLLGNLRDTITGLSEASVFTQFNAHSSYVAASNTLIDSMILHLYIPEYLGDMNESVTFRVYEATERLYMDSLYYSDHATEGNYRPGMIGEKIHRPGESDTVEIMVNDPAFIQRFLDVQEDSALFSNDSLFKDHFRGLYITAGSAGPKGVMARLGLSNVVTRLTVRYANDSTFVDSTDTNESTWATFPINEFSSQKINVFRHDYADTELEGIIDNEEAASPYAYVQGMAGVNTLLSFDDFQEWFDEGQVSVSSARLIFDVVPEDVSGIPIDELPGRLMLYTQKEDGTLEFIYDYVAINSVGEGLFGGTLETISKGMFYDTTYRYSFNMNLHFQYMVDGAKSDPDFRLRSASPKTDTKFTKLWSNLFSNPSRIRLEVVYLKL